MDSGTSCGLELKAKYPTSFAAIAANVWKQIVANHSLAMSQQSHWKYSGICSWGGVEVKWSLSHLTLSIAAWSLWLPCIHLRSAWAYQPFFSALITVWSVTISFLESSYPQYCPGIPGKFSNTASSAMRDQSSDHRQVATEQAGVEMFWLLCDVTDCPVSSKARLPFLKTKLRLFLSACCSESWSGYKTIFSFQSHQW